jgi:hypothetical protein
MDSVAGLVSALTGTVALEPFSAVAMPALALVPNSLNPVGLTETG